MKVLMIGVGPKRVGGMRTVAEQYINNKRYNESVNLKYVSTSTNGTLFYRFLYMIKGYIETLVLLQFWKPELVHVHMAEKGSTFRTGHIVLWAEKQNIPVIIHLHAGPFMAWYQTLGKQKKEKVQNYFLAATRVLVLGEYWKKDLEKIVGPNKINVLYNGVASIDNNQYNADSNNIIFMGVINREKGIYDLVDALSLIDAKYPEKYSIMIYGKDMTNGDICRYIQQKNLKHKVKLNGWISGSEKDKAYKNAVIDILPSYYEGLSMSVIEAMSYGVPMITTDISTMPELLNKSQMVHIGDVNGIANKILEFILSKKTRMIISREEYDHQHACFSETAFIDNTLKIYNEILY